MKSIGRRIAALEGERQFYSLGELLDSLDGEALPPGKFLSPSMGAAIDALPKWKPNHADT